MFPKYYALRQLNPYRGVLQVIDLGDSEARSHNGVIWQLRSDDGNGQMRQSGVWEEGKGLRAGQSQRLQALIEALEAHPDLPFAIHDTWEYWLLDQERGEPLALLAADRQEPAGRPAHNLDWYPFLPTYTGFRSALMAERDNLTPYAPQSHRDFLARLVNRAARPLPRAQWFHRGPNGVGEGAAGIRLPYEWRNRRIAAENFPELLVREGWNSRLETSVIADYHAHLSPLLLLWPRLSNATRSRLELLACQRPQWLERVQRLLAVQIHPQQLRAALVAARLSQAAGEVEKPWIDD